MGILISQDSGYGKEMWKFERFEDEEHPSDPKVRGTRKRAHQPFPVMLSKVRHYGTQEFDEIVAHDEDEVRRLESRGYVIGRDKAMEAFDLQEAAIAEAAANRKYGERSMSERAQAEAETKDHETLRHLPEIPETPIHRRGRPKRADAAQ